MCGNCYATVKPISTLSQPSPHRIAQPITCLIYTWHVTCISHMLLSLKKLKVIVNGVCQAFTMQCATRSNGIMWIYNHHVTKADSRHSMRTFRQSTFHYICTERIRKVTRVMGRILEIRMNQIWCSSCIRFREFEILLLFRFQKFHMKTVGQYRCWPNCQHRYWQYRCWHRYSLSLSLPRPLPLSKWTFMWLDWDRL